MPAKAISATWQDVSGLPAIAAYEPQSVEEQVALLERRLARSEAARAVAEDLLEQKSRILAAANEELLANKQDLSASLQRSTQQLLDAQRVAGLGTLIWDIGESRWDVSAELRNLAGLAAETRVTNFRQLVRSVFPLDRRQLLSWLYHVVGPDLVRGHCRACQRWQGGGQKLAQPSAPCRSQDSLIEFRCHDPERADGIRWLRVMAQVEFDQHCQASLFYLTAQDVTCEVTASQEAASLRQREWRRMKDLEKANADLITARENAERANAAKSRFLAMMSHDIRTPLNGVLGMLDLLEEKGLCEEQQTTLSLVRASGQQLRVLLDDIIDFARAEAGRLKLSPEPACVTAIIEERVAFWRHLSDQKGLSLTLEIAEKVPAWISVDTLRLRQLVDNLLSNAVKYTREGGVSLHMTLTRKKQIRIEVRDTGPGIPADRVNDLFDDFEQLERHVGEAGSAGLGLAICRRVIDVMGGQVGVESDTGGSCFWIEFPCECVAKPGRVAGPVVSALKGRGGRRARILVAEDVATNRVVIKGHLQRLDCEVTLVEDGAQAVEAVIEGDFDLVLLDMAMPVMDGTEAARMIRGLPGEKGKLPIVALTAYARPEELAPIMQVGANASATKPIDAPRLRDLLAGLLNPETA